MVRSIREGGQPTPKQVVKDALQNTPPHELAEATSAQTDHHERADEALNKITTILQDALDDMADEDIPDSYTTYELRENARILSDTIPILLELSPDEPIPDSIETKPGHFIRHFPLPKNNHSWRIVAAETGTLELRTGPFYDSAVKSTYESQLKSTITLKEAKTQPKPDGREALVEGIKITISALTFNGTA